MNFKHQHNEFVDLIKIDRQGAETRESMPRWLAELSIGCIAAEEPNVARARIEQIQINPQAHYPVKSTQNNYTRQIALQLAAHLPNRLVG